MNTTNDKGKRDIPLTPREKNDIHQAFAAIITEMKKHGLPNVGLVRKAFSLAYSSHGNTRRKTGEPYILHPLHVAKILANDGHESTMVASAILHDVLEDCGVDKQYLENEFGIAIADTVDAVTKVSEMLAPDEEMSKLDLDELSDEKFIDMSKNTKNAVYIKCADRIHNLRTIDIFPEDQQKAKAYHTRNVIIPVAKKMHVHNLVDILSDLCLKIENPEQYKEIKESYKDILRKNKDTFEGEDGLIEEVRRMVFQDDRYGSYVKEIQFAKRSLDSIHEDLLTAVPDIHAVKGVFTKNNVALYDLYFITGDEYMDTPESLFFKFYDRFHSSDYQFTIVGSHSDGYEYYYILKDWYDNKYRLFIQSETEHLEFTHGLLVSAEYDSFRENKKNTKTEPGSPEMITVFKKDETPMIIESGATVLDFAFAIDPNIGICAKYAHLNGSAARTPIYTRLKAGDMIEVVSDHDKQDQENDISHATIRWFEYLRTREATKRLSRWLEKHMDAMNPTMLVYDSDGKEYEVDMACTVLDFAFAVDERIGLHLQEAYINKSHTPTELNKTLRHGDKVKLVCDFNDTDTPVFSWLGIVKTKKAKDRLIEYFRKKYGEA